MSSRHKLGFVGRLWYYFRVGFSTYLNFLLGAVNTLIVVWYLAIKGIPSIEGVFAGRFITFAIVTSAAGIPLAIGIGWMHFKRSPAYRSEVDISMEANPYYFKWPPGYWLDVIGPVYQELLAQMKQMLLAQNLLTQEQKTRIENLEKKLEVLNTGGMVGSPRTNI